jgi:Hg(II)-responsive transcriptional regulator
MGTQARTKIGKRTSGRAGKAVSAGASADPGAATSTIASKATADSRTIGALARAAGVGVETVRYYERRGLLLQPPRPRAEGYRRYPPAAAARLRFIRRAQQLGFTLDEVAELLQLADGTDHASIHRIASARLQQLEERIADMQQMADTLRHLVHACANNGRAPHCPIIESISEQGPAA